MPIKKTKTSLNATPTIESSPGYDILQSLNLGLITTDLKGSVRYINPAAEALLTLSNTNAKGKAISEIMVLLDPEKQSLINLSEYVLKQTSTSAQFVLKRHNLNDIFIDLNTSIIKAKSGAHQGISIIINDISDTYTQTLQLKHQATHDALTGLVNYAEFNRRLVNLLSANYSSHARHSLIYLDLHSFKEINKLFDHQASLHLLKQVSSLLTPTVRHRDTLASLGADKFAVLLENCPKNITTKIAEDLLQTIKDFRFTWSDRSFDIEANLGVTYFSSSLLGDANEALNTAIDACTKAKALGKNKTYTIDISNQPDITDLYHDEIHWVETIKNALKNNHFVLFQQLLMPMNPGSDELLHYEILLRMKNSDGKLVTPGTFLPAAERYNIIHKIDRWVVENTFKWLSKNPSILNKTHLCSINLSGQSLSDNDLADFVQQRLENYHIDGDKICFEITETSVIHNLGSAQAFIKQMQSLGCSFSLDDFGTGMSSFSYLKNLPVNHLKIDGAFIKDLADDTIDLAMTRSINDIGHVMGMKTVAEFVESKEILQLLKQLGVDYAQGFHIAKPAPLNELL